MSDRTTTKQTERTSQVAARAATKRNSENHRRLTDKILDAFTHAHSVGERKVATQLRDVLEHLEGKNGRVGVSRRAAVSATGQADRWVEFVAVRDEYTRLLDRKGASKGQVEAALTRMKESYLRWSRG